MTAHKQEYEGGYLMADPGFFEMFSFTPVQGDLVDALVEPGSIVLTERGRNHGIRNRSRNSEL